MLLFTPQPQFHRQSPYAQRSRCIFDPSDDYYSVSGSPYHRPSYANLQQARARAYRRQLEQQLAEEQAAHTRALELERYRQAQAQALERERLERRRYLAELERQKYLDAFLRARSQRQGQQGRYHPWFNEEGDEEEEDSEDTLFSYPSSRHSGRRSASPSPFSPSPQVQTQAQATAPAQDAHPQQHEQTKLTPTLAQQNAAASLIQSFVRTTLARRKALSKLKDLRTSFDGLRESFVFPEVPSFELVPSPPSSPSSEPAGTKYKLSYSTANAPIHFYEDSLMRLLSSLDSIESNGDRGVRAERKALARDVEGALGELDSVKEANLGVFLRGLEEEAGAKGMEEAKDAAVESEDGMVTGTESHSTPEPSPSDIDIIVDREGPQVRSTTPSPSLAPVPLMPSSSPTSPLEHYSESTSESSPIEPEVSMPVEDIVIAAPNIEAELDSDWALIDHTNLNDPADSQSNSEMENADESEPDLNWMFEFDLPRPEVDVEME